MHIHDSDSIVIKYSGHIFGREFVCGVADEKARLAHGSVSNHNAPRRPPSQHQTTNF